MVHEKLRGRPRKAAGDRLADRQSLIDAAVALLQESGAAGFSARRVAERTGTAVGTVYTLFDSLEALRLEANAVTMRRLRVCLAEALATGGSAATDARLLHLADAYLSFAADNHHAWAALFERRTIDAPPAIEAEIAALFAILEGVLREAGLPDGADIPLLAKALWSSVHGMVYLGEIGGLGPVRPGEVPQMVRVLVGAAVRGLVGAGPPEASRASAARDTEQKPLRP